MLSYFEHVVHIGILWLFWKIPDNLVLSSFVCEYDWFCMVIMVIFYLCLWNDTWLTLTHPPTHPSLPLKKEHLPYGF